MTLRPLVGVLLDHLLRLGLLLAEEGADPLHGLGGDDDGGAQGGLAVDDEPVAALAAGLLVLGAVDAQDVVLGLEALVQREQHHALGVGVQLARLLLDDGELGVDLGQRLVAEVVGLLDVRGDVLVGLLEVGHDRGGEGLVGRVAQLQGLLAVGIALEGLDAIVDDRVVEEVLRLVARQQNVLSWLRSGD